MVSTSKSKTFAMVVGEHSGDILGAGLIKAIKLQVPDARFVGVGGPHMNALGFESWYPMESLAVMGIVDVLKRLPQLLRMRSDLARRLCLERPDIFIGIDAPDFNLGLERKLKEAQLKTLHYVSPSIWAWRSGRVKGIAQSVDKVLTLFPFEAKFYQRHGVDAHCVGHPLADQIPLENPMQDARKQLGLDADGLYLSMLPGSRVSEIKYLGPCFIETLIKLKQKFKTLKCLVPMVNSAKADYFRELLRLNPQTANLEVDIRIGESNAVMAASNLLLMASGTATLEALLHKKPMVIAYKWHPLTHALISPWVKIPYIGLPNILADQSLVPEFVQDAVQPQPLADALAQQLQADKVSAQKKLLDTYMRIHKSLRLNASKAAAAQVLSLVGILSN